MRLAATNSVIGTKTGCHPLDDISGNKLGLFRFFNYLGAATRGIKAHVFQIWI